MENSAAFEGMVGHHIGAPAKCDKPVTWAMCGDGLWEIRRNSIGMFRRHAAEAVVPGLPAGPKEGFELALPRIPIALLWQAVSFFRHVYGIHQSEAAVRAVWNRKSRRYALDCPPQEVSAARCNFDRHRAIENSVVVAEIHSHGQMAAGFSGTDDKDELADRFYGIVGRVLDFFPQVCFRLAIGGHHLAVDVCDLFDTAGDPMLATKFPPGWLDQVKRREAVRPPRFQSVPKRFLDDPDDPENDGLHFPGWGSALPSWDFVSDGDGDGPTKEEVWDAMEAEEQERWRNEPRRGRR